MQLIHFFRKKLILLGSFSLIHWLAQAQEPLDSIKNNRTEIVLVYNHYIQDGNNSAVEGGAGTEKMTVYGPSLSINRINNKREIGIQFGSDIISSASVDNIDFISSVSMVDIKGYINTSYKRSFRKFKIIAGSKASVESDYFSLGGSLGIEKTDNEKLTDYRVD